MVQLKEEHRFLDRSRAYLFQFLMVQLKGLTDRYPPVTNLFQFLMVQLKVEEAKEYHEGLKSFQFLMVQLKVAYFTFLSTSPA